MICWGTRSRLQRLRTSWIYFNYWQRCRNKDTWRRKVRVRRETKLEQQVVETKCCLRSVEEGLKQQKQKHWSDNRLWAERIRLTATDSESVRAGTECGIRVRFFAGGADELSDLIIGDGESEAQSDVSQQGQRSADAESIAGVTNAPGRPSGPSLAPVRRALK